MITETISYTDGGHANRTATLERADATAPTATLVVGDRRVELDLAAADPGGAIASHVTTPLAVVSYAVLGLLKQWKRPYGDRVGFEVDGHRVVGLFQEHPKDKGKNYPHPGLTLLEPTGGTGAPQDPLVPIVDGSVAPVGSVSSSSGRASATDWLIVGGCAVVGLLLVGAAVSGVGLPHGAENAVRTRVARLSPPASPPHYGRVHLRALRGSEVAEWLNRTVEEAVETARPLVRSGWRCYVYTPEGRTWDLGELVA